MRFQTNVSKGKTTVAPDRFFLWKPILFTITVFLSGRFRGPAAGTVTPAVIEGNWVGHMSGV